MAATVTVATPARTRRPAPPIPLVTGEISDHVAGVIETARRVGVQVHREDNAVGTGKLWRAAPLIIVDVEAVRSVYRCRLSRHRGVIMLATKQGSDAWATAEVLGASYLAVWPLYEPWLADRFAEITI